MSGAPACVAWVIGEQHWPRAFLRAELIERGYDAVGFVRLGHALEALARALPSPQVVVLDLRGQRISTPRLRLLARSGAALVALGGALELANPEVVAFPWAARLHLPITIGQVVDSVDALGRREGPSWP